MKFLEIDALEIINEVLCWENGEASITGRVEAYSCKYRLLNPIGLWFQITVLYR
jgi:hypothetical protein